MQRVLDAFPNPAIVKTPTWDIVAWNGAASAVLADYASVPASERNVLRRMFGYPAIRASLPHWESDARFAPSRCSAWTSPRAGGRSRGAGAGGRGCRRPALIFRRLWAENDVRTHWVGQKSFDHPVRRAVRAGNLGLLGRWIGWPDHDPVHAALGGRR
ncbi:MAG: hypothetical protein WDM85_13415 [Caulobacteraceae bacterium]